MTYVVTALAPGDLRRRPASVVAHSLGILAAFGALSLLGTMLAARRGQVWTMERLHPSLEI